MRQVGLILIRDSLCLPDLSTNLSAISPKMSQDSKTPVYVLVTGGAGYIGSHIVLELLQLDYYVLVADNFANAARGSSSASKPGSGDQQPQLPESLRRVLSISKAQVEKLKFVELDMQDRDAISSLFETHSISCVVHMAALKAVGESVAKPLEYYAVNVGGTVNLLLAMKKFNVKKVIYSSSATVYGLPEKLPIEENHPTGRGITNPYGKTKYFCEEIIKDLCTSDQEFQAIVLRYFNPVGAHSSGQIGEDPQGPPNNLMPFVAQVAIGRRDKLKVYGNDYDTKDGTGVRDYIHVVDLARGHVTCIKLLLAGATSDRSQQQKSATGGESEWHGVKIYNLGTGSGQSVLDMIKAFEHASGKKVAYELAPRRAGDIGTVYAGTHLAETELKWKTEFDLEAMCRDLWNWQIKNPQGYDGKAEN